MREFIKKFSDTGVKDVADVGRKNAFLGELCNNLSGSGINFPPGFSITTEGFSYFMHYNKLEEKLAEVLKELDRATFSNVNEIADRCRKLIGHSRFPRDLEAAITQTYSHLFPGDREVAVRSSAFSPEDCTESFESLYDSYLNIKGSIALLYALQCCYASLYQPSAILYRENKGIDHDKVQLSVGVYRMVRADKGASGTGATYGAGSGFSDAIKIRGFWGLGGSMLNTIVPDEFVVNKTSINKVIHGDIEKKLGSKTHMIVYYDNAAGTNTTQLKLTPGEIRERYSITDADADTLAQWALIMESYYKRPVYFEWAKDGLTNELYIVQVHPETVLLYNNWG